MGGKWHIRIGTRTTPRKQSAIRAALSGTMLTRHYNYVQPIYQSALFWSLRGILPKSMSNQDVMRFAEDRINDAFVRIKEYDRLKKADPSYRFRSFLVKKIIFPALKEVFVKGKRDARAVEEHSRVQRGARIFEEDYKNEIAKEFVRDALLQLRKQDEIKYEVFCRRHFDQKPYKAIYQELKDQYTLTITSVDATRKTYQRAIPKLKHLFREIKRKGRYVDKDLPFNKGILARLRAETTRKA